MQTAVIGHGDSEAPVVLPPQTAKAKAFRRAYRENSFWCGTLLAGCGAQLMIRIPTGKVAHFAHYPQHGGEPVACRRTAVNAGSADHLYIKAALSAWLTSQGHTSTATLPTEQATVGSVVEIRLTSGTLIRIHLDSQVEPTWSEDVITILSADVPVPPELVAGCRYIHRIRCESDGSTRRVLLGTELPWRGTRWYDLTDCTLTSQKLATPGTHAADERARAKNSTPAPRRAPRPAPTPVRSVADPRTAAVDPKYSEAAIQAAADIDAAREAQDPETLRARLDTAERISQTVKGTELARLLKAMTDGRGWLASAQQRMDPHSRKRLSRRLQAFARLRSALDTRNPVRIATTYEAARRLATSPISAAEHKALEEARHRLEQSRPARTPTTPATVTPITAAPAPASPPAPRPQKPKQTERQKTENRWSPLPTPAASQRTPTFLSAAVPPPGSGTRKKTPAPRKTRARPPQPAAESSTTAEAVRLTQCLRDAMKRNDDAALARLIEEAVTLETDQGPAARDLRLALAGARSRLRHPQKAAAVTSIRTGLAKLAKHAEALPPHQLAASIADLQAHAATAGSMLPAYDRAALSSWSARLAEAKKPAD
ncbi:competence protein CoiA family protein [Streptomyces xiamenensis]|uniref:competence protein CoiA family protein n=1 Tax=Streptomyces xiamenensis TaxID=408015 RepID=UPI0035D8744C